MSDSQPQSTAVSPLQIIPETHCSSNCIGLHGHIHSVLLKCQEERRRVWLEDREKALDGDPDSLTGLGPEPPINDEIKDMPANYQQLLQMTAQLELNRETTALSTTWVAFIETMARLHHIVSNWANIVLSVCEPLTASRNENGRHRPASDEDIVEGLHAVKSYDSALTSGDVCPICMDPYSDEKSPMIIKKCGHVMCLEDIRKWLSSGAANSNTCPYCRGELYARQTSHADEVPIRLNVGDPRFWDDNVDDPLFWLDLAGMVSRDEVRGYLIRFMSGFLYRVADLPPIAELLTDFQTSLPNNDDVEGALASVDHCTAKMQHLLDGLDHNVARLQGKHELAELYNARVKQWEERRPGIRYNPE